jgi:transcriptional regulator with XRE-family HTH domain
MGKRSIDPDGEPLPVTDFIFEVGDRLKAMRLARNITQADMAVRAMISRTTLAAIEAGKTTTRFVDVARVLWAMDDHGPYRALADAGADPLYPEVARAALRKSARPGRAGR